MRHFVIALTFVAFSWACSGDCLSCHPKLQATILGDPRHEPMLGCINCHREETSGVDACGKDCFTCHPADKISQTIVEHRVIPQCRECHLKIVAPMDIAPVEPSSTQLKSFIFQ